MSSTQRECQAALRELEALPGGTAMAGAGAGSEVGARHRALQELMKGPPGNCPGLLYTCCAWRAASAVL